MLIQYTLVTIYIPQNKQIKGNKMTKTVYGCEDLAI